jgi:hypothetical protein
MVIVTMVREILLDDLTMQQSVRLRKDKHMCMYAAKLEKSKKNILIVRLFKLWNLAAPPTATPSPSPTTTRPTSASS